MLPYAFIIWLVLNCLGHVAFTQAKLSCFAGDQTVKPWMANAFYPAESLTLHESKVYECLQAHISQSNRAPPDAAEVWQKTPFCTSSSVTCGLRHWEKQVTYLAGMDVQWEGVKYVCNKTHVALAGDTPDLTPTRWMAVGPLSACKLRVAVDEIEITNTRSKHFDTLTIVVSVTINGQNPVLISGHLGEHTKGRLEPHFVFTDVDVQAGDDLVIAYIIVNNDRDKEAEVIKSLESSLEKFSKLPPALQRLSHVEINQNYNYPMTIFGIVVSFIVSDIMRLSIDSSLPFLMRQAISMVIGWLAGFFGAEAVAYIEMDCSGAVAAAAHSGTASDLTLAPQGTDYHLGLVSYRGCGSQSEYHVNWSVQVVS